jgi:hypothetical protein
MRHVGGNETLLALAHQHSLLKVVAVIHGAFAVLIATG